MSDETKHSDLVHVEFYWDGKHGGCYDCGRPAAFYGGDGVVIKTKLCAVCAANWAVDDEEITRIEPLG